MESLFRVTLGHETAGTLEISEPGGWDEGKLYLVRNKEFHGMDQLYDQPLTFYGEGLQNNGGIQFIRDIETTDGPDAQITILIELSLDEGYTYETLYTGILSLDTLKEIDFYKADIGTVQEDFWSKFINRKDTPVDLMASVDLDGQARTPISSQTIPLPTQIITTKYRAEMMTETQYYSGDDPLNVIDFVFDRSGSNEVRVGIIELPVIISDTLEERFTYTNGAADQITAFIPAFEFIAAKYKGSYAIDIQLILSTSPYVTPFGFGDRVLDVACFIRKNEETPIELTKTQLGVNGTDGRTQFTYSDTWDLVKGDKITLYFYYTGGSLVTYYLVFNEIFENTWIEVSAATTFEDTQTEGILLKDAAESILSKIIGTDDVIVSSALDGCLGLYSLQLGLHIRGKALADKPISMSWDDWWKGANSILNLGLAYEKTGSPQVSNIRIEKKEYFYDKTTTSVNLDWVNNIERSYDMNSIIKSIEIGFEKSFSESDSGLDAVQTKSTYSTRFKTIGKSLTILSNFIAEALTLERTRRNQVDGGNDDPMDEEIFIIALREQSPGYTPELDENFSTVTGILNPTTRYNLRLSVARIFERWKSYFNGCLQWYVDSPSTEYAFAKGEGNTTMETVLWASDCEAVGSSPEPTVIENQNIPATTDFLYMPVKYTFSHPMTWEQWKAIRDNSTLAIGVSRTDADHVKCFIESLEYEVTKGKGNFVVWLAENNPIT